MSDKQKYLVLYSDGEQVHVMMITKPIDWDPQEEASVTGPSLGLTDEDELMLLIEVDDRPTVFEIDSNGVASELAVETEEAE